MPEPAVDHRRATAQRNAAAILDAAERLLASGAGLSMAGVATEAGVSRPTLYAHYATLADVVEAAVDRAIAASLAAVEAAEPERGPADAALLRMVRVAWGELARQDGLGRAAAEHLSSGRLTRAHAPLMARLGGLVARGQAEGTLRDDLSAAWLVTAFFALVHAAADHAREHGVARAEVGEMLERTVADLFARR